MELIRRPIFIIDGQKIFICRRFIPLTQGQASFILPSQTATLWSSSCYHWLDMWFALGKNGNSFYVNMSLTLSLWEYNLKHVCMFTIASCRPMLPTVTPPEKNMHGSQERTYRKSGDVYLKDRNHLTESLLIMERGFSDAALWVRSTSAPKDNPDKDRAPRRKNKTYKTWNPWKYNDCTHSSTSSLFLPFKVSTSCSYLLNLFPWETLPCLSSVFLMTHHWSPKQGSLIGLKETRGLPKL